MSPSVQMFILQHLQDVQRRVSKTDRLLVWSWLQSLGFEVQARPNSSVWFLLDDVSDDELAGAIANSLAGFSAHDFCKKTPSLWRYVSKYRKPLYQKLQVRMGWQVQKRFRSRDELISYLSSLEPFNTKEEYQMFFGKRVKSCLTTHSDWRGADVLNALKRLRVYERATPHKENWNWTQAFAESCLDEVRRSDAHSFSQVVKTFAWAKGLYRYLEITCQRHLWPFSLEANSTISDSRYKNIKEMFCKMKSNGANYANRGSKIGRSDNVYLSKNRHRPLALKLAFAIDEEVDLLDVGELWSSTPEFFQYFAREFRFESYNQTLAEAPALYGLLRRRHYWVDGRRGDPSALRPYLAYVFPEFEKEFAVTAPAAFPAIGAAS